MAHDINAALERLEESLKNIDTARQQVEKTVTSSSSLQQIVSDFIENFQKLSADINIWIDNIKKRQTNQSLELKENLESVSKTSNTILENIETKSKQISGCIKANADNNIAKLTQVVNNLNKEIAKIRIEQASDFKDKLDSISNTSTLLLNNFTTNSNQISEQFKQKIATNISDLSKTSCDLKEEIKKLAHFVQICDSINQSINNLQYYINEIQKETKKEWTNHSNSILENNKKNTTTVVEKIDSMATSISKMQKTIDDCKSVQNKKLNGVECLGDIIEKQTCLEKEISSLTKTTDNIDYNFGTSFECLNQKIDKLDEKMSNMMSTFNEASSLTNHAIQKQKEVIGTNKNMLFLVIIIALIQIALHFI